MFSTLLQLFQIQNDTKVLHTHIYGIFSTERVYIQFVPNVWRRRLGMIINQTYPKSYFNFNKNKYDFSCIRSWCAHFFMLISILHTNLIEFHIETDYKKKKNKIGMPRHTRNNSTVFVKCVLFFNCIKCKLIIFNAFCIFVTFIFHPFLFITPQKNPAPKIF